MLAFQVKLAEWGTTTPVPDSEIVMGEFDPLLVIVTPPVTLPEVAGAKISLVATDAPGLRISPFEIPFTLKPEPEIVTLEMLTSDPPELVSVMNCVLLLPTFTLPKARLEVLELS